MERHICKDARQRLEGAYGRSRFSFVFLIGKGTLMMTNF